LNPYYLILAVGIVAGASSALFIQASTSPPSVVVAFRLLMAALILLPVLLVALKKDGRQWSARSFWLPAVPGAAFLSLHLITWTVGVRMTSVANASLIVNLMPVAMPFAMFFVLKEKITAVEIAGSVVALVGVGVLTLGSADFSMASLKGDFVCGGSMLFAVAYLVSTRVFGRGRPVWTYVVPVYFIAGLIALGASTADWHRLTAPSSFEWLMLVCLALIPTVIGHSAMQITMLKLPSQTVSIANLGQFICAAVFAWIFFNQTPKAEFYLASPLIVIGAMIVVFGSPRRVQLELDKAPGRVA